MTEPTREPATTPGALHSAFVSNLVPVHRKMHCIWGVEDIVRVIHGYGSRDSQIRLGLTCRWLFACSIDLVWRDVPDLNILSALLDEPDYPPADPQIRNLGLAALRLLDHMEGPKESDGVSKGLKRFRFYARFVRQLAIRESAVDAAIKIFSVVPHEDIATTLPQLQKVDLFVTTSNSTEIFTTFLLATLSAVTLSIGNSFERQFDPDAYALRISDFKPVLRKFPRLDDFCLRGSGTAIKQLANLILSSRGSPVSAEAPSIRSSRPFSAASPFDALQSLRVETCAGFLLSDLTSRLFLPRLNLLHVTATIFAHTTLLLSMLDAPLLTGINLSTHYSYEDLPIFTSSLRASAEVIASTWPKLVGLTIEENGGTYIQGSMTVYAIQPLFSCHALEEFHFQTASSTINFGDGDIRSLAEAWPDLRKLTLRSPPVRGSLSYGGQEVIPPRQASLRGLEYLSTFCLNLEKLALDTILEHLDQPDPRQIGSVTSSNRNTTWTEATPFRVALLSTSRVWHLDVGYAPQCNWEKAVSSLATIFPNLTSFRYAEDDRWPANYDARIQCMEALKASLTSAKSKAAAIPNFSPPSSMHIDMNLWMEFPSVGRAWYAKMLYGLTRQLP